MSTISLAIPHEAAQALGKLSSVNFGMCVVIALSLLAILSIAMGVAPIVDPVAFPTP